MANQFQQTLQGEADRELAQQRRNMTREDRQDEMGLKRWEFEQRRSIEKEGYSRQQDAYSRKQDAMRARIEQEQRDHARQVYEETKARTATSDRQKDAEFKRDQWTSATLAIANGDPELVVAEALDALNIKFKGLSRTPNGDAIIRTQDDQAITIPARTLQGARIKAGYEEMPERVKPETAAARATRVETELKLLNETDAMITQGIDELTKNRPSLMIRALPRERRTAKEYRETVPELKEEQKRLRAEKLAVMAEFRKEGKGAGLNREGEPDKPKTIEVLPLPPRGEKPVPGRYYRVANRIVQWTDKGNGVDVTDQFNRAKR